MNQLRKSFLENHPSDSYENDLINSLKPIPETIFSSINNKHTKIVKYNPEKSIQPKPIENDTNPTLLRLNNDYTILNMSCPNSDNESDSTTSEDEDYHDSSIKELRKDMIKTKRTLPRLLSGDVSKNPKPPTDTRYNDNDNDYLYVESCNDDHEYTYTLVNDNNGKDTELINQRDTNDDHDQCSTLQFNKEESTNINTFNQEMPLSILNILKKRQFQA